MVLSSRCSSTASAAAAALTCASAMGALLFGRPGDCGVVVGFCLGDVGPCARRVVLRLIERLLRGGLAARQRVGTAELLLRVFKPRFCLGDFGLKRSDLLSAHTGIDVIAVGGRGAQRRARLPDRRGQLDCGALPVSRHANLILVPAAVAASENVTGRACASSPLKFFGDSFPTSLAREWLHMKRPPCALGSTGGLMS